jgi:hypothetical protein
MMDIMVNYESKEIWEYLRDVVRPRVQAKELPYLNFFK